MIKFEECVERRKSILNLELMYSYKVIGDEKLLEGNLWKFVGWLYFLLFLIIVEL